MMHDNAATQPIDPDWGSQDRPKKAEAIWQILVNFGGPGIGEGRWLDLGCGSGGIAAALAPRIDRIVGVDPQPWQRWKDFQRQYPNLSFLQESVESLSLADASVDVVICNQVYEHVPDAQQLIREIHRILKPGGYCYFAGPNLLWPIEPHVFWPIVHWLPRGLARRCMKRLGAKHLVEANSTTYWQLQAWFHGFTVRNGLPFALRNAATDRWKIFQDLFATAPFPLIRFLTPLSPAFIFILKKHDFRVKTQAHVKTSEK